MLEQGKKCVALPIENATFYDCGNKLEYLKTVVTYGLKHEQIGEDFGRYLKRLEL